MREVERAADDAEGRRAVIVGWAPMTSEQRELTFLFADLSGFTALTEVHGDEEAAELAGAFFKAIRDLLEEHGATEVKTIGDAMMLHAASAADGVELGLRIVEEFRAHSEFPSVRVGMNTGAAVERDGDWFGAAVNLAARISAAAADGHVLVSEATLDAAGELDGVELRSEGERLFRNVGEPVRVFRALRGAERGPALPIDPVCRMAIDPDREAGRLSHLGREYHFCSLRCVSAFASDPERYVSEG
jgi:adenylate cyclase